MLIVKTPSNPNFNEKRAGVQFKNGVGIFEDEAKAKRICDALGYELIKPELEKPEEPEVEKPKEIKSKKKSKK